MTAQVVGPGGQTTTTIVAPLPLPVLITNPVAFTYAQGTAAAIWEFDHPLLYNPNITVEDSAHTIVEPDILYSPGHVRLDFGGAAMSGWAYLS